jgi:hypothetical protein
MTPKERITAVFEGRAPDVVPWFGDLTYWYNAMVQSGQMSEKYQGEGVVQLYKDLGVGAHEHVLAQPWEQWYDTDEIQVKAWQEQKGDRQLAHTEWITPVGSLHQVQQYEQVGYTWAYLEYPVKDAADLRTLQFLCHHTQVKPSYAHQQHQIELWGEQGIASSIPPRIPLANLIVIWAGVMNTTYALADDPDEVWRTVEALDELDDKIYPIVCGSPAPMVYFGENITSEVVSPKLYKEFYIPFHQKRGRQIHEAGKHGFVHIDGTMRGVLELFHLSGIECAQSLTPYPVGDVAPSEMRQMAGPDVILWTGVPGAYFSHLYPDSAVEKVLMECLEHLMEGAKLIIGVCDQMPPDGQPHKCELITKLVEEHGRY